CISYSPVRRHGSPLPEICCLLDPKPARSRSPKPRRVKSGSSIWNRDASWRERFFLRRAGLRPLVISSFSGRMTRPSYSFIRSTRLRSRNERGAPPSPAPAFALRARADKREEGYALLLLRQISIQRLEVLACGKAREELLRGPLTRRFDAHTRLHCRIA